MAVITQIQLRRGTAAVWTANNPTLAAGEFGFETDTRKAKIGDGVTAWNSLAYALTGAVGTVTSVASGTGITGGPITSTGTLSIDTAVVATLTGTQTLTNKSLSDSTTFIVDATDGTKKLNIDVTGTTGITGTLTSAFTTAKTLTLPDATDTLVGKATTDTLTNKTLTAPIVTLSVNTQTGTTFTPALSDAGSIVTLNNAAAIAVTIPTNASVAYAIGSQLNFVWITGAGQPTISAVTSGTTTILSTGATSTAPKLRVVNSVASAIKIATDTWIVTGDIA